MPFSPRSMAAMRILGLLAEFAGSPEESWPMALTAGLGLRGYSVACGYRRGSRPGLLRLSGAWMGNGRQLPSLML